MPTYEFDCKKCKLIFEHLYMEIPQKMPKKKKCPECGKLSERILSLGTFKISGRTAKIGKSNVLGFYNDAIEDSKERLKLQNTPSPYQRYKPNIEKLTKDGTLRKITDKEKQSRQQIDLKVRDHIEGTVSRSTKK